MNQKIDILIVEPGKEPRLSTVTNDLETLGKNMGLPPNRPNPADSEDAICGTFLLCSFEGDRFTSLTPAQQMEFQSYFALSGSERGGVR